eukprot:1565366-Pyramimonas_sp.AAC.1
MDVIVNGGHCAELEVAAKEAESLSSNSIEAMMPEYGASSRHLLWRHLLEGLLPWQRFSQQVLLPGTRSPAAWTR